MWHKILCDVTPDEHYSKGNKQKNSFPMFVEIFTFHLQLKDTGQGYSVKEPKVRRKKIKVTKSWGNGGILLFSSYMPSLSFCVLCMYIHYIYIYMATNLYLILSLYTDTHTQTYTCIQRERKNERDIFMAIYIYIYVWPKTMYPVWIFTHYG